MNPEQWSKWWKAFRYAMELGGLPIASAAVIYKGLGGDPLKILKNLSGIVESLKKFQGIRGTSASLYEWTVWALKNSPEAAAALKGILPKLVAEAETRSAVSSSILIAGKSGVVTGTAATMTGRVALEQGALKSIGGAASVAWTVGWIAGSIAYAFMEVFDYNDWVQRNTGMTAAWETYYRWKSQITTYGWWGWWEGVGTREEENMILQLKLAERRKALRASSTVPPNISILMQNSINRSSTANK
jgi:hypothetical protein